MSRYGFDSLSEQQRENRVYHDELPLPTYEEVVAGAVTFAGATGLKTEVLLTTNTGPSTTSYRNRDANEDVRSANPEHSEVHYEPRFTSSRKSSVLVLIGLILIPLCALIVFIQLKGCAVSHQSPSSISSEFLDGDSLDSLYTKCVDEKNNLLQLIHDVLGTPGSSKLFQNYESALNNKEELEASLQNLREQLKILHIEKEKLEWLLAHANKTFTQSTLSDNRNVKIEDATPVSNIEVTLDNSEQKSQPARKKSLQERISEWSKISPNTAIQIETAMQEVQDFIKSTDKT